jgi:hypothetical protein
MEFPEPTIDVEAAARALIMEPLAAGSLAERTARLRSLLAQAWEEGRWSPPGACANPYGEPAQPIATAYESQMPGTPLLRLRAAVQAALAWIENMAPTVRRTALAEQLRSALGDKP